MTFDKLTTKHVNSQIHSSVHNYGISIAAISEMIKQLGEKYNLPLKTGFNGTKGFFVQLTLNRDQHIDLKTLPSEFLKAVKVRSAVCFTTVDLVSKYDIDIASKAVTLLVSSCCLCSIWF